MSKTMTSFRYRNSMAITIFVVVAFCLLLQPVQAAESWRTEAFNSKITVSEDHVFHVRETIKVDFRDIYKHGIIRYIPYEARQERIRNLEVRGYEYETGTESIDGVDYAYIKVGDPDSTVKGKQTYVITYDIRCFKDSDTGSDLLYLDMLPTGWETAIDHATVTMTVPKDIPKDALKAYSGTYGSTGNDYFVTSFDGRNFRAEGENLPRGGGLTTRAYLPDGYWVNPVSHSWAQFPALILLILGALMSLTAWLKHGRDTEKVIETVEFHPPEDMDPMEVAHVLNATFGQDQIGTMLISYANRGQLSIQESGESFRVKSLKAPAASEPAHRRTLFDGLFSGGSIAYLDDLPEEFGESIGKANEALGEEFSAARSMFTPESMTRFGWSIVRLGILPILVSFLAGFASYQEFLTVVAVFVALIMAAGAGLITYVIDTWPYRKHRIMLVLGIIVALFNMVLLVYMCSDASRWLGIAATVCYGIMLVATVFMPKRQNLKLYGQALGFKHFIETAEMDRLKMLVDADPNYYFDILPYAMVFGLETQWTEKFSSFSIAQPSWYTGSRDLSTSMPIVVSDMSSRMSESISQYVSSYNSDHGGGGGGGGGFSGGGSGGGGGGSW